jgi:7-cyano-7-deazaguanine synthase
MIEATEAPFEVTVLLSGGIDSAACVAFYKEQRWKVRGFFVDYGQVAARREEHAAKAIASHFDIPLSATAWTGLQKKGAGYIRGRNGFLLFAALLEIQHCTGVLAIGLHSGTRYLDCAPSFVRKMQSVFDIYSEGRIQIGVPFLSWSKSDIWAFSESRVPLSLTYSCEQGVDQPCGHCDSCLDLEALHACS